MHGGLTASVQQQLGGQPALRLRKLFLKRYKFLLQFATKVVNFKYRL
jgi:hypothetical protein